MGVLAQLPVKAAHNENAAWRATAQFVPFIVCAERCPIHAIRDAAISPLNLALIA
jgi:hypothetical protein